MEKLFYLFVPSFIFLFSYVEKKESILNIIRKYSLINIISNFISFLIVYFAFKNKTLGVNIIFCLRYVLLSIMVNMGMVVIYKCVNNFVKIGLEINYEKKK